MVEEGQPNYIEQDIAARDAAPAGCDHARCTARTCCPMAGEYTARCWCAAAEFFREARPEALGDQGAMRVAGPAAPLAALNCRASGRAAGRRPCRAGRRASASAVPSARCSRHQADAAELGTVHVSADIGCHTFGTLPPFNTGSTVLGYGLGLASSARASRR
jgi:indolepyruvate ferredoxin oxidoreductase alpha subunit